MTAGWHVEDDTLQRYVAGRLPDSVAWSIEAHVDACPSCRDRVSHMDLLTADGNLDGRLEAIWSEVNYELDKPRRRPAEWLLERVGVPEHVARLLAATPALTASWMLAVAGVLLFAAAASWASPTGGDPLSSRLLFLLLAPLAPLAGVAAAFGPRVDPTYEIGMAAPIRGGRLLFIRAAAVLSASFVLAAAAALLLPGLDWTVAAWIVPALAVTAVTLAVSTVVEPVTAAVGVAILWLALATSFEFNSQVSLAAFRAGGQAVAMLVFAAASVVLTARRQRFDTRLLS